MEFNATFLVSIVSFVLFTLLMNKIFYVPVSNIIREREELIKNTLDEANSMQKQADGLNEECASKLNSASSESRKIISDNVDAANKEASSVIAEARKNYSDIVSANKGELEKQSMAVREELKSKVDSLAEDIVARVLG